MSLTDRIERFARAREDDAHILREAASTITRLKRNLDAETNRARTFAEQLRQAHLQLGKWNEWWESRQPYECEQYDAKYDDAKYDAKSAPKRLRVDDDSAS